MTWNCKKCKQIESISDNKAEITKTLNAIFNYNSIHDKYDEKVIFFEESYVADGIIVNDIELVECLAKIYGKENIIVKIHPRNPENRFKKLGYKTNVDTNIPWEVIALNIDLDTKILVSMTSTAVVSSFLLFHSNAKMIMEYKYFSIDNERLSKTIEVIEKIKEVFPDRFFELNDKE